MQYQVPQFIETEDKIIGGVLTLKQFLIIAAAAGVSFIFYFLFEIFTWLLMTTFVGMIAFATAFVKVQGRSVPTIVLAAVRYYWNPRFYLWRSEIVPPDAVTINTKTASKNAETPKQFSFHRKDVTQKITMPNKNPTETPAVQHGGQEAKQKAETAPLNWQKTDRAMPQHQNLIVTVEPPGEKIVAASQEDKLLKKEALLEHEVEELEGTKARLESEMQKMLQEKSPTIPKNPPMQQMEVTPRKAETPAAFTQKEAIAKKTVFRDSLATESNHLRENSFGDEESLQGVRHKLATAGSKVQNLYQKLSTSKTSLPKRERKLIELGESEKLELLRKATGEMEFARRVDYSDSRHK